MLPAVTIVPTVDDRVSSLSRLSCLRASPELFGLTGPCIRLVPSVTTASQTELDSIRRILDGEKYLFHQLIRPCEKPVYFLLLSMLKNEAETEKAVQETLIKVYRNLHLFRGDAQFRTWVLSIARNEGLGRLRKLGSLLGESLDARPWSLLHCAEQPAHAIREARKR